MTLHLSSAGNLPFRQQRHTHTQGNVILWDTTGVWGALGDCVHLHVKNCKDKCFCAYAANNLNSTVSLPLNARQRFPHQAPHCGEKKKITAAHFSHYITAQLHVSSCRWPCVKKFAYIHNPLTLPCPVAAWPSMLITWTPVHRNGVSVQLTGN